MSGGVLSRASVSGQWRGGAAATAQKRAGQAEAGLGRVGSGRVGVTAGRAAGRSTADRWLDAALFLSVSSTYLFDEPPTCALLPSGFPILSAPER